MYEFSSEEKQSMHKLINPFIVIRRYQSCRILQRIDEGKLTKRDLGSIQKKLTIATSSMNGSLPTNKDEFLTRLEIAKHVAIVDNALSRYRLIDWK
jgi:hypothetical protein